MNAKLPEFCYYKNVDGETVETVIIRRGMSGYFATDLKASADELNIDLMVSKG